MEVHSAQWFRALIDFILEIYYLLSEMGSVVFKTLSFSINDALLAMELSPITSGSYVEFYNTPIIGSIFVYGLQMILFFWIAKFFFNIFDIDLI